MKSDIKVSPLSIKRTDLDSKTRANVAWEYRQRHAAADLYNLLIDLNLTSSAATMTEENWISTSLFFNGCALCDSQNIFLRDLIVPYNLGGRYILGNVIPICEDCFQYKKKRTNLWYIYNRSINKRNLKKSYKQELKNIENFALKHLKPN